MHHAVRSANIPVVRALVAWGADVNAVSYGKDGDTPLTIACGMGGARVDLPDRAGMTALDRAIQRNASPEVRDLLNDARKPKGE